MNEICELGLNEHAQCVSDALQEAERICARSGARLTEIRRHVLELVWSRHKPITAYEILDLLKEERRNAAPPTVYRALDFLLEQRLIHRLDSLNAFVGCSHPAATHRGGFFICTKCQTIAEIRDSSPLREAIKADARAVNFTVTSSMIEILGICGQCVGGQDEAASQ